MQIVSSMQILSTGDNFHEMSNPVVFFLKIRKKNIAN